MPLSALSLVLVAALLGGRLLGEKDRGLRLLGCLLHRRRRDGPGLGLKR